MSTKSNLYKSISKSMLGRYSVYAANVASMMVLARIFSPETFGIVASIAVLFIFFQMLSEAGLGPAIINIERLEREDRDGIFGLTVTLGLVLAGVFYLCSPIISEFYRIEQAVEITPYAATGLFFYACSILPTAFLLRAQHYFKIALAGLAAEIASTLSAITLQFAFDPIHALAAKSLVTSAINFYCVYLFSKDTEFGRPTFGTKFSAIKPLLSFSAYQFSFNVLNYFTRNLDNILVAKYMGATSLGVYDKAYQLMRYPLMLLTFAMTPAIQPVIRQHAHDIETVESLHRDFTFKLSLAGALAGLLIFLFSEQIVNIILGSNWEGVVPLIKILAISIPVQTVLSTSGSFFQALDRTDLLFRCGVFSSFITVTAILYGISQRDLTYLSWSIVIAFHINFIQAYLTLYSKILKTGKFKFFLRMFPAATATAIMASSFIFKP